MTVGAGRAGWGGGNLLNQGGARSSCEVSLPCSPALFSTGPPHPAPTSSQQLPQPGQTRSRSGGGDGYGLATRRPPHWPPAFKSRPETSLSQVPEPFLVCRPLQLGRGGAGRGGAGAGMFYRQFVGMLKHSRQSCQMSLHLPGAQNAGST